MIDYYEDYDLFISDVAVSELCFGDADGDGLTDIFVRINYFSTQQWGVLYNYGNRRFSKPVYRTYPDIKTCLPHIS